MTEQEATDWIQGSRSMSNIVPEHPFETWQLRIAQADAAQVQRAYWVLKAYRERLTMPPQEAKPCVR
jgi:hypothetical protein